VPAAEDEVEVVAAIVHISMLRRAGPQRRDLTKVRVPAVDAASTRGLNKGWS